MKITIGILFKIVLFNKPEILLWSLENITDGLKCCKNTRIHPADSWIFKTLVSSRLTFSYPLLVFNLLKVRKLIPKRFIFLWTIEQLLFTKVMISYSQLIKTLWCFYNKVEILIFKFSPSWVLLLQFLWYNIYTNSCSSN